MPRSDPEVDPMGSDLSFSPAPNVPVRNSPNSDQNSDHFNAIKPQSLHQAPLLDAKPRTWSRKNCQVSQNGRPYYDSEWNEKRGSRPPALNGNRYGAQDEIEFEVPPRHAHAYRDRRYSKPLLEYARNEWRNDLYDDSSPSSPTYSDFDPSLAQMLSAPRFRRYVLEFLAIVSFMSFFWITWIGWVQPAWAESKALSEALSEALNETMGARHMLFGHNMTPAFLGVVQLKTLDESLVPRRGDKKRLVVVGDVHGCHDELVHLLTKISFNERTDHLIFTGDLVSKGPSSPAVIDLAISLNASCVRGNHEDRILLAHRDTVSHPLTLPGPENHVIHPVPNSNRPPKTAQPQNASDEQKLTAGGNDDRLLAQTLTTAQINYLSSCPLILHLGGLGPFGPTTIVHAGLVPGVPLERQDPNSVMKMRTIDLKTHVPSSHAQGMPWAKVWNKYQSLSPKEERQTVIYGHDSRRGLRVGKWSMGLDSSCVRGGRLTAVVVGGGKKNVERVSVKCRNYIKMRGKKRW